MRQNGLSDTLQNTTRSTVLITGASSGIGLATTRLLAAQGHRVYAASRNIVDQIDDLIPEPVLRKQVTPLKLDILDESSCRLAVHHASEITDIDALIHCAGAGIAGSVEETPLTDIVWQFDNLLFGTIRMVQAVLPGMRARKHGRIVLISSVAAAIPIPFQTYYSSAKAAVHAFALGLNDEVLPHGICVTVVAPGDTRTGFTDARRTSPAHPESPYRERLSRSVARMAHDEQNGMRPEQIAQQIVNSLRKKKPGILVTPGLVYQLFTLLSRFLPLSWVRRLVRLLYA
ncbi:MAG: SDR family oxidoreductase [Eubacteriales bacterium]|nr:SDR family oxidoreductase [Eubacteriales bacterium]